MDFFVPLKIKLMVRNAIEYSEWIEKDVDIEKGDSETLRYASFLCKLKVFLFKFVWYNSCSLAN